MGGFKKYLRQEFTASAFGFDCPDPRSFSVSCWQTNVSPVPLLVARVFLFLSTLTIVLGSLITFSTNLGFWFIYMTHWGLLAILFSTGVSVYVSASAYLKPRVSYELPWYVKVYWVLFNIATPMAFFITIFYWTLLSSSELVDFAPNKLLDVALHGLNSVIVFLDLMLSGHISRVLHFYQPLGLGVVYLLFGVIYYFAGGVDPWGNQWIYPMIDWSKPAETTVLILITAVFLCLMHLFTVALVVGRDIMARYVRRRMLASQGIYNDGFPTITNTLEGPAA